MVSVIIPTHNRVELLPRAINSVLNQTYQEIEVIVVSDGSTDGTDALMEKYANNSRIKYINYTPAHGGNYARNTGVKMSNGDYVAFLDDDDEWLPTKIEEQMHIFNTSPNIGLVYTGTNVIYENADLQYKSIVHKSGDLGKEILFKNYIGSTTTVMVRKKVFDEAGLFDEKLSANQDYDLWIRVCQIVNIGVVMKPLVNYYNSINSEQISSNTQKYIDAYNQIDLKYANLLKKLSNKELDVLKANREIDLGLRCLRNCDKISAVKYFINSFKYQFRLSAFFYIILSPLNFKYLLKLRQFK